MQISARAAPAPLAVGRALKRTGPLLLAVVEIAIGRQPSLYCGSDKGVSQFPADRLIRDTQGPANAMRRVGAALLVLGFLEVGQHAVPVPADAAALAPQIVVGRIAAHI